ncbi:hypothetical protein [Bdellovibrio sp. HCB337]|uniref:hypothetical protein n=1 Tax=Bdellovibrio sp. HCB337 TaxID=3394358 RepID=UPI0039A74148
MKSLILALGLFSSVSASAFNLDLSVRKTTKMISSVGVFSGSFDLPSEGLTVTKVSFLVTHQYCQSRIYVNCGDMQITDYVSFSGDLKKTGRDTVSFYNNKEYTLKSNHSFRLFNQCAVHLNVEGINNKGQKVGTSKRIAFGFTPDSCDGEALNDLVQNGLSEPLRIRYSQRGPEQIYFDWK